MTFKLINRVRMSLSGTAGTGPLTLNTQGAGFQSMTSGGMANGDTTPYVIEDGAPIGVSWEIGVGTYHSNGTFSRDTVTQSSLGGSTKISVTSNAILSATFRGQDLAGIGKLSQLTDVTITSPSDGQLLRYNGTTAQWENSTAANHTSAPSVVQYQTIQQTSVGAVNVTLGATPTQGNLLIALGVGGGGSPLGVYTPGFNFMLNDVQVTAASQSQPGYGIRSARISEVSTLQIGTILSSGPGFAGVLVEVQGVDITGFTSLMANRGGFSTTLSQVQALATTNALSLLFGGGANVTCTPTNPSTLLVNSSDGSTRMVFDYVTAAGAWNGISATLGGAGAFGVLVMNLPGA